VSWHYLQGQEEASWEEECLDGAPDALSKLIPSAGPYCLKDREMGTLKGFQSGTTSEPLMDDHGPTQLTLLPEDSPAKESAQRVRAKDLPTAVLRFGSRCSELLERLGLSLCSRKTVRISVPMGSAPSSKDLTLWGMTFDGACWELGTSVRHIEETGSGYLLPTPTASQYGTTNNGIRPRTGQPYATKGKMSLSSMAAKGHWPDLLATPTEAGNQLTPDMQKWRGCRAWVSHPPEVNTVGGPLSPYWVEWLMGWPIGWTDLNPLETDKFQSWQQQHLKYFPTNSQEQNLDNRH